jgi:hypothetical protein
MTEQQVANLSSIDQLKLKRGKCPWCGRTIYDGTLDQSIGYGDICYDCNIIFFGALTISD